MSASDVARMLVLLSRY